MWQTVELWLLSRRSFLYAGAVIIRYNDILFGFSHTVKKVKLIQLCYITHIMLSAFPKWRKIRTWELMNTASLHYVLTCHLNMQQDKCDSKQGNIIQYVQAILLLSIQLSFSVTPLSLITELSECMKIKLQNWPIELKLTIHENISQKHIGDCQLFFSNPEG